MDVNTFSGKYYRVATLTKSYPTVTGIIITVMDVQTLIIEKLSCKNIFGLKPSWVIPSVYVCTIFIFV